MHAVADDGPDAFVRQFEEIEQRFRAGLRGFEIWQRGCIEHLTQSEPGRRALRTVTARAWRAAVVNGLIDHDLRVPGADNASRLAEIARAEGMSAALAAYDELEGAYRRLHDAHRDVTSLLLDLVYETGDTDALDACLRDLADRTLMRWMVTDVEQAPEQRLPEWCALLTANFARITVTEHDDRFTIVQDPCGTCTRQILDGRIEQLGLQSVPPFAPEHVGAEPLPSYRAHVGLMHWVLPTERIGHPWPVIHCPHGCATGPCRIELHKQPRAAR